MLELFDFLWKASSAKAPFKPEVKQCVRALNLEKDNVWNVNIEFQVRFKWNLGHLPQERCMWQSLCPEFPRLASIVHQNWFPFIYHYFCDVEASHIKSLVLSIAKRKLAKPIVMLAELKSYWMKKSWQWTTALVVILKTYMQWWSQWWPHAAEMKKHNKKHRKYYEYMNILKYSKNSIKILHIPVHW